MSRVPTPADGLRQRLDLELERLRTAAGDNLSRYALTRLHPTLERRQVRFGVWNAPVVSLVNPDYRTVTQEFLGRLDILAYLYYEDPRLWWVIARANRIKNPLTDMEVGQTLIIPRKEAVNEALSTGNPNLYGE